MQLKLVQQMATESSYLTCSGTIVCGKETTVFMETLRELIRGSRSVVVDLGSVTRMDCSGLGALALAAGEARSRDKRLVLRRVPGCIRNMLRLTKLDSVIEIQEQAEAARADRESAA